MGHVAKVSSLWMCNHKEVPILGNSGEFPPRPERFGINLTWLIRPSIQNRPRALPGTEILCRLCNNWIGIHRNLSPCYRAARKISSQWSGHAENGAESSAKLVDTWRYISRYTWQGFLKTIYDQRDSGYRYDKIVRKLWTLFEHWMFSSIE